MKIVLFIPTLKQGGAERVMTILANTWAKQNETIHLILFENDSSNFYNISSKVKIHYLNFTYKGKLSKLYSELKAFFKLRKTISKTQPDFVLSFMTKYNVLVILATCFLNKKIYVSDRSNPNLKLPKLISFLRKHTYKYASGVIAQTKMAKDTLQTITGNKNIEVIPNPLNNFSFDKKVSKENIILNVGRLTEEKGQKYLIKAFSKLKHDNWRLVILGEGKLKLDLEKLIEKLSLQDRVILKGSVKNVDEWLSKSSIFAFSSISEGFPNALVEAMAFGLPCVAFDCDAGPRDIIENGNNGFLAELKNIDDFSKKIDLLIKNPKLREKISLQAKKVQREYNSKIIAKRILNFCSQN